MSRSVWSDSKRDLGRAIGHCDSVMYQLLELHKIYKDRFPRYAEQMAIAIDSTQCLHDYLDSCLRELNNL